MPSVDGAKQDDAVSETRETEREKTGENVKDRSSKSKGAASKTKDLSHVPCKFFRVGSCTAGSSCPFSHSALEPGQHKETCAWFIKGNCKFGHKCALAHILPGQSMSMDRKNKKAAQKNAAHAQGAGNRSALFSGSTAPTRTLSSSRSPIPMPLKATLSPSAPAPPVKDTDFPSFESDKLPSAPAQNKTSSTDALPDATPPAAEQQAAEDVAPSAEPEQRSPSPLPMAKASTAHRNGLTHQGSPSISELGPIGSPPRNSPGHTSRVNGFSPGASPANLPISSSPFSAPGNQTAFMLQQTMADDFTGRSGLSASLGASFTWGTDRMHASKSRQSGGHSLTSEVVVEDEDLEEFIPGSLTDLLTPEERSRRFSRNPPTRPNVAGLGGDAAVLHSSGIESHHRYSRSVPAPSLLEDIRSIWATDVVAPGTPGTSVTGGGLGNGTPSSFQSTSGLSARVDEMLAPSNASAAFLPGLHHYINTKPAGTRSTAGMQTLYPQTGSGSHTPLGNAYQSANPSGLALSPPRLNSFAGRPGFDAVPSDSYLTSQARLGGIGRGGGDGFIVEGDRGTNVGMSPSARALQQHAPGQSLPQGLAAGYSRIHALPPPVIPSPSTSGAFSPGRSTGFPSATKGYGHSPGPSGEWHGLSPAAGAHHELPPVHSQLSGAVSSHQSNAPNVPPGLGGLETMFSRLSYSAAASRPTAAPPGMVVRNPSGRGYNGPGPTSPLSGPVLTGDDDDVFDMEN
ncbi:hypothetical protein EUX98_g7227 [Antrodiella citrinella]|uniref:C3H1-type domain-containing protein n=1 Tax=Antrodiella citrinella TaxID=2447956 RepID=A0A4V6S1S3_9APHY|nr:hypothetical protein EUX98_g7227 [Antrodiella citrinella]